ncbi:MAG: GDSL-type esterase/lipase family protein [Lentisphaerae bacterium]|nr:GDSL-type esterase/lipase family protein [Lentisphaerota bacterium]
MFSCFSTYAGAVDADGIILGAHNAALAQPELPAGWSFECNLNGPIGDPAGYVAMVKSRDSQGRGATGGVGVDDGAGGLRSDAPSQSPHGTIKSFRDKDGVDRYAIASYTMQEDAGGAVWINHGNLWNRASDDLPLLIYLNDEVKYRTTVVKDSLPHLFQQRLGRLKKGDVIRVAVGPGVSSGNTSVKMQYLIVEYPEGRTPGPPINMLAPAINEPAPRWSGDGTHDQYREWHEAQCAEVLREKPGLVLIGDSITQRWPADLLAHRYGKYRPVNLGVGGDWIQNALWRVINGVLDQAPPRVAVLLIGTNNLSNGYPPEEVVRGIDHLVQVLRGKAPGCKVLILGILPRGPSLTGNRTNQKTRQVNTRLALLADDRQVFFLDIGDVLAEPDGTILPEIMPDGLHVAGPGYLRWLEAMAPMLDRLLGKP